MYSVFESFLMKKDGCCTCVRENYSYIMDIGLVFDVCGSSSHLLGLGADFRVTTINHTHVHTAIMAIIACYKCND